MLFAPKTKAYYFEQTEHACFLARTTAGTTPLVIEELREIPAAEIGSLPAVARELAGRKQANNLLHAACSIYPASRVLRRTALEPKRAREAAYLNETVSTQFRLEPDAHTLSVVYASDGAEFDGSRATQREALFGGARTDELDRLQDSLVENGIYPERLELGSDSTHSYIVSAGGVELSRPVPLGLGAMLPVVQKELGLRDEESARKLFFSNTFDFTGLGPQLTRRLVKELQSSIGFYEVQTGQSIGHLLCTQVPAKLAWLQAAFAHALGVPALSLSFDDWLRARGVHLPAQPAPDAIDARWLGLLSLILPHDAPPAEEKK